MNLIKLEDLYLCRTCHYYHNDTGHCNEYCDYGEMYRPAAHKFKVIDAVPVIRCNKCYFFQQNTDFGICGRTDRYIGANDFCSRAVLKDETN